MVDKYEVEVLKASLFSVIYDNIYSFYDKQLRDVELKDLNVVVKDRVAFDKFDTKALMNMVSYENAQYNTKLLRDFKHVVKSLRSVRLHKVLVNNQVRHVTDAKELKILDHYFEEMFKNTRLSQASYKVHVTSRNDKHLEKFIDINGNRSLDVTPLTNTFIRQWSYVLSTSVNGLYATMWNKFDTLVSSIKNQTNISTKKKILKEYATEINRLRSLLKDDVKPIWNQSELGNTLIKSTISCFADVSSKMVLCLKKMIYKSSMKPVPKEKHVDKLEIKRNFDPLFDATLYNLRHSDVSIDWSRAKLLGLDYEALSKVKMYNFDVYEKLHLTGFYKDIPNMQLPTVYILYNKTKDKFYVGQAKHGIADRWRSHMKSLRNGFAKNDSKSSGSYEMIRDIMIYNDDAYFTFINLNNPYANGYDSLDELERALIYVFNAYSDRDHGYNKTRGNGVLHTVSGETVPD